MRGGSEKNQEHENSQTVKQKHRLGMASKTCLLTCCSRGLEKKQNPENRKEPRDTEERLCGVLETSSDVARDVFPLTGGSGMLGEATGWGLTAQLLSA